MLLWYCKTVLCSVVRPSGRRLAQICGVVEIIGIKLKTADKIAFFIIYFVIANYSTIWKSITMQIKLSSLYRTMKLWILLIFSSSQVILLD